MVQKDQHECKRLRTVDNASAYLPVLWVCSWNCRSKRIQTVIRIQRNDTERKSSRQLEESETQSKERTLIHKDTNGMNRFV